MINWIKEWFETWRVLRDHPDVMKVLRESEAELEITEDPDELGYFWDQANKMGFLGFNLDLDIAAMKVMMDDWMETLGPVPGEPVFVAVEAIRRALTNLDTQRERIKQIPDGPMDGWME